MNLDLHHLPDHVMLGLSGGADSVALLLLLLEAGKRVEAVHVNHGLRGAASDGDEAFVRALCGEKGVPLAVYRLTPPENPGEDWARQERHRCFLQALRHSEAQALVLAHHMDDQAETILMRLMRGAGLTGLTAIAEDTALSGARLLRPLLHVSRSELREMLIARGQPWREDASNADPRYLRNAIRRDVMPLLEQLAPGATRRMAEAASLLRDDEDVLRHETWSYMMLYGPTCLPLAPLSRQKVGMQRRLLRYWWLLHGHDAPLDRAQTEALQSLLAAPAGQRCNLPGGWHAYRGWTHLHLLSPVPVEPPLPVPARDGAALSGTPVHISLSAPDGTMGDGVTRQLIPEGWLEGLTLRTWQPGDTIRPFGMAGHKSMQDYFTDKRIDAPFRHKVPLVCRGSEVLLCAGVGAGDVPRATDPQTGVMLTWSGRMPWHDDTKG